MKDKQDSVVEARLALIGENGIKKPRGSAIPSKAVLQSLVQSHTKKAIKEIVFVMKNSKSEHLRLEAARIILNKSVPDIRSFTVSGENGNPIRYNVLMGNGFIPAENITEATEIVEDNKVLQDRKEVDFSNSKEIGTK